MTFRSVSETIELGDAYISLESCGLSRECMQTMHRIAELLTWFLNSWVRHSAERGRVNYVVLRFIFNLVDAFVSRAGSLRVESDENQTCQLPCGLADLLDSFAPDPQRFIEEGLVTDLCARSVYKISIESVANIKYWSLCQHNYYTVHYNGARESLHSLLQKRAPAPDSCTHQCALVCWGARTPASFGEFREECFKLCSLHYPQLFANLLNYSPPC